ncbi:hypothetical protein MSG28_006692 [Choristoneura fumiferana]|uniref:Uncharacterized protein n=1 Tax=Choristoneura fumiferana TaxID=7141 RepID=A0ACC0JL37_CHOFU|nr:hypothetical protein MSG28_006692 [Choristoneura fumiferana]
MEDDVFLVHGIPQTVVLDNGTQFNSHEMINVFKKYKIPNVHFTPKYTPQINTVERYNKSIVTAISTFVNDDQRAWDVNLSKIRFAMNNSVNEVTGYTPAFLVHGRELVTCGSHYIDNDTLDEIVFAPRDSYAENLGYLSGIFDNVQAALWQSHKKNSQRYNSRRKEIDFNVGDIIWKRCYLQSNKDAFFTKKLAPKYQKCRIKVKRSPLVYIVEDMAGRTPYRVKNPLRKHRRHLDSPRIHTAASPPRPSESSFAPPRGVRYIFPPQENQGLIPRICRQLFSRVAAGKESGASYRTEVSYLEIYNERVKDLLAADAGHSLRVREHPKLGPYVQDLSKHLVSDYDDIQECMHRGNLQRTTASTQMNDVSSRSHAIFTITFVQASYLRHNNMPSETASKVHLVDLAGSERADATGATGQRLVEGAHINKSLVTLGSVISALAESSQLPVESRNQKGGKKVFIPYRDSVLTWLLKDSLGGNSKTIMIAAAYGCISRTVINPPSLYTSHKFKRRLKHATRDFTRAAGGSAARGGSAGGTTIRAIRRDATTQSGANGVIGGTHRAISPADCNYGETLSTLRYANRAKNIINKPTINEDPNVKLIRELREEIDKLRKQITHNTDPIEAEPAVLATLQRKEAQEKVLTEKWTEKWRETQQILQEQKALGLRKSGLGVVLDSDMPHLVGIDDNLLSTGVTLYHLKEGETVIGTEEHSPTPDIVLTGAGVLPLHCRITLHEGVATLHPAAQAHCWLNTVLLDKAAKLSQGCILLLGRTNMFRYNDPAEAAKLRQEGSASVMNLSRLSLLSWSTTDLAASTENLNTTLSDLEGEIRCERIEAQRAELERERQQFILQQEERQRRWHSEREELLQAQRKLDEEREAMEREYAAACRRLSGDWRALERGWTHRRRALRTRRRELGARADRLRALAGTHARAADNEDSHVAALRSRVNEKKAELEAALRDGVDDLRARGCLDTPSPTSPNSPDSETSTESLMHLLQQCEPTSAATIRDTVDRHKKELVELEGELQSRVASVASHRVKVERLQAELALLGTQDLGLRHALCADLGPPRPDGEGELSPEGVKRSKSELVLRRAPSEDLEPLSADERDLFRNKRISAFRKTIIAKKNAPQETWQKGLDTCRRYGAVYGVTARRRQTASCRNTVPRTVPYTAPRTASYHGAVPCTTPCTVHRLVV